MIDARDLGDEHGEAGLFGFIVRHSVDAIVLLDADGRVLLANDAARSLFGPRMADLGIPLASGEVIELDVRRPDGSVVVVEMRKATVRDGGEVRHVVSLRDVSHYVNEIRRLQTASHQDPLTGVLNRRGLMAVAEELALLARREHRSLTLVVADVDGLKSVNDRRGHQAGDEALRRVAEGLRSSIRHSDAVGRLGGDEFVVVLWDTDDVDEVVIDRLRAGVRAAVADMEDHPEVSLGVERWRPSRSGGDTMTIEHLLAAADARMYVDKRLRLGLHVVRDHDDAQAPRSGLSPTH